MDRVLRALGIKEQAKAPTRRVSRLADVPANLVEGVIGAGRKGVIVELTRDLIGSPILSVKGVMAPYRIS